jgi:ABC-2 type transport system permease protein
MRILEIIKKSLKESLRSYWILALTILMAPFFVGVYYLINASSKPVYDILFLNLDKGTITGDSVINYGNELIMTADSSRKIVTTLPVTVRNIDSKDSALILLKNKKADVLIIIPEGFSDSLQNGLTLRRPVPPLVEFTGDMNDFNYLVAAIWGSEIIRIFIESTSGFPSPYILKESGFNETAGLSDFDLYMPGLLVLSVIMLMFTASIAFVTEIENGTILRYRLSGLKTAEFITGVTFVQLIIGLASVLITLWMATLLGFHFNGSFWLSIVIFTLAALSVIGFSVILGALSKSANEILIIGNFPLFLFMFFTGAAFPMQGKTIMSIGGYPLNFQSLMSPTHAVIAIKKVMLLNSGFRDIVPELVSLLFLTFLYFGIGIRIFNKRHMKFGKS